jgi:NodT family efflux transporter outer membrane factor (OMF) lipoprotein
MLASFEINLSACLRFSAAAYPLRLRVQRPGTDLHCERIALNGMTSILEKAYSLPLKKFWLKIRISSALVFLLFSLCGCTSNAPPNLAPKSFEVPPAWSIANAYATTDASLLTQWWSRFNDPILTGLVAQAMQSGTSVKIAQAALHQARALRDVSLATLWPSVNASASAGRSKIGNNAPVNSFATGLDARWELDIFGANRSALSASEATARASAASLGDVQVSIAAEVALDYIALRGAQKRLGIANDNLNSQLETLQLTRWRLQAGLVSSLEVEQARAAAEQTRALLPTLQTGIDQGIHALSVLTGQPPATLLTVLSAVSPIPQVNEELALSIPADALRQRPDVRATEHQVTAAQARLAQADAARMPKLTLSGSFGLSSATSGALTRSDSLVNTILAGVLMPVFDGGALRAQARAQQAALEQAHLAYQAKVLLALAEVEDALVALHSDRERLQSLQQAAEAASNAALMAQQRYAGGLIDFQTVLDTQRSQLTTQDSVAIASGNVSADHVRLYKALGGGWRSENEDPKLTPKKIADRTSSP